MEFLPEIAFYMSNTCKSYQLELLIKGRKVWLYRNKEYTRITIKEYTKNTCLCIQFLFGRLLGACFIELNILDDKFDTVFENIFETNLYTFVKLIIELVLLPDLDFATRLNIRDYKKIVEVFNLLKN
jgi:hypothetical protein